MNEIGHALFFSLSPSITPLSRLVPNRVIPFFGPWPDGGAAWKDLDTGFQGPALQLVFGDFCRLDLK